MTTDVDLIKVEVAWATAKEQAILAVNVPKGASIETAIRESGVLSRFPEIDLEKNDVGVFGERRALDFPLKLGDRVEIYRPLLADPKEVRRRKAEEAKKAKQAAKAEK